MPIDTPRTCDREGAKMLAEQLLCLDNELRRLQEYIPFQILVTPWDHPLAGGSLQDGELLKVSFGNEVTETTDHFTFRADGDVRWVRTRTEREEILRGWRCGIDELGQLISEKLDKLANIARAAADGSKEFFASR